MKRCSGCGLLHPLHEPCSRAEARRDHRDLLKLRRAIRWALGMGGEFPYRKDGEGIYYWRTELRRRFGSALKPLSTRTTRAGKQDKPKK